jgi:hypothetical protein
MIKINKYVADLVRFHNQLMVDGHGNLPVIQVYEDGDSLISYKSVMDAPEPLLIHSKEIRELITGGDEIAVPNWFETYDGYVIVI